MAAITISPRMGARRLKKIGDQIKLNPSWATQNPYQFTADYRNDQFGQVSHLFYSMN